MAFPSVSAVPGQSGRVAPQAVFVLLSGLILAVLDATLVNVALPLISAQFQATASETVRVVNAYQISLLVALLPLSSAGDRLGYRRVYACGVAVFTLASALCMMARSFELLIAARALQGLGAAGVMSVNPALVRLVYPARVLSRGIALNSLTVAAATAIGPTVAAVLLSVTDWRNLFAINLPIGLFIVAYGWRRLPVSVAQGGRFDTVGALLSAASFGLTFVTLERIAQFEPAVPTALLGAAALLTGIVFVRGQAGRDLPLLPLDLLRIPVFALSMCTSVCSFMAQGAAFVALPFMLHGEFGMGPRDIGLALTPWPLAVMVASPLAARLLQRRVPAGLLGAVGLAVMAAGMGLLGHLPHHAVRADTVLPMALCGFGFGLFQSPNNHTILTAGPAERSGGAGGLLATARLCGQTTGAAIVAMQLGLAHGTTRLPLYTATGIAALAAVFSASRMVWQRRPRTGA